MKKYILISIVLLLSLVSFTPIDKSKVPIKNIQGLQDSLNSKPDTSEVNLIINNINPHDSVWFKDETYHKDTIDLKLDNAITYTSNNQNLLNAIGSPIVAKPFELSWASGGTVTTLTSGILYTLMMEPIAEGTIATGVKFCGAVAGVFTENNFNGIAVYRVIGDGTYERVAISANDGNVFKNANSPVSVPFTSPATLVKGLYLAAFLYSSSAQTTAPTIFSASVQATNYKIYNNTAVARLFGCIDAQTSMPATLTAASLTNYPTSIPMMFLYK